MILKGLRKNTVNKQIVFSFLTLTVLIIGFETLAYFWVSEMLEIHSLKASSVKLKELQLHLKNASNEFILREKGNRQFFATGNSAYLDRYLANLAEIQKETVAIQLKGKLLNVVDEEEIKNLNEGIKSFHNVFVQMVDKMKQRGFGDFGLIGEFDKSINSLLEYNFGSDIVAVLNLQLFVKDYLLTGDEKLKNNISNEIFNFTMVLEKHVKDEEVDKVSDILLNYETVFNQLTQVDDTLGIYSGKGLQGRLFEETDKLDNFIKLKSTDIKINDLYEQNLSKIYLSFFLVVGITILAAIIINQRLFKTLVVPIQMMKEIIARMSRGEVPQANMNFKVDDLSEMAKALNNLVRGTRNYQDFANKIGNGNLNADFVPLSDEDILGNSLLAMRDSLKMNAEENKKRSWAANGLAEISTLIRTLASDESELFNKVLQFIVKYTASNQGSLFILNQDEKSEQYLEMVACYAWDKRKHLEKKILLGDGLAGQCALEGEVIYLTDFPAHYIKITSGLGSASPNALLIVPLKWDDHVVGVLEIASFGRYENHAIDLIKKFSESIAAALNTQKINRQARILLEGVPLQEKLLERN